MKKKLILSDLERDELRAYTNAINNQELIDNLYAFTLRNQIKYSEDQNKVEAYEAVWEEIKDFVTPSRGVKIDLKLLVLVFVLNTSTFIFGVEAVTGSSMTEFICKLTSVAISFMIVIAYKRK